MRHGRTFEHFVYISTPLIRVTIRVAATGVRCLFFITIMPKGKDKRKKIVLTVQQKLEILDKLKCGRSGVSLAQEYGIGTSTVADIKKAGPQLREFAQKHHPAVFQRKKKEEGTKTMKLGKYQYLDEALFKWHQQHSSSGVSVRGVELQSAAETLAKNLGITGFNASPGWLWRFRKRHLLGNKRVWRDC